MALPFGKGLGLADGVWCIGLLASLRKLREVLAKLEPQTD